MKTINEINGFVGGITKRPNTIFICENNDGSTWYVAEGGNCVNRTWQTIENGTWIEELSDYDCYTVTEPINTIEEFENSLIN